LQLHDWSVGVEHHSPLLRPVGPLSKGTIMSAVSFEFASKAVEKIIDYLCNASYFAEDGKADEPEAMLKAAWALEKHFGPTVRENFDRLAGVSDGVIRHHTATGTESYASAHEAIIEICAMSYAVFHIRRERVTVCRRFGRHHQVGRRRYERAGPIRRMGFETASTHGVCMAVASSKTACELSNFTAGPKSPRVKIWWLCSSSLSLCV